jgi:arylsulfatase A-like enzyme
MSPDPGRGRAICDFRTSNVDFYPTFTELAGLAADAGQDLDGVSLVPLLEDPQAHLQREALYWHYPLPLPHFQGGRSSGAIRKGEGSRFRRAAGTTTRTTSSGIPWSGGC